jgi:CIC family chloride channel protein
MIFEVTRDYAIIVPLMISNLIAYFTSFLLQRQPIYEALAHQDGVHLPASATRAEAGRVRVSHAMRVPGAVLSPDMRIEQALAEWSHIGPADAWPVTDRRGLRGILRKADLEKAISNMSAAQTLGEILENSSEIPHVHPDHALSLALERMGARGLHVLPVVSRADVRQLLGVVVLDDILAAYGVEGTK